MRIVLAIALALLGACDSSNRGPRPFGGVGGGSACESRPSAPGCRFEFQRPDDGWRTSGFGSTW